MIGIVWGGDGENDKTKKYKKNVYFQEAHRLGKERRIKILSNDYFLLITSFVPDTVLITSFFFFFLTTFS